MNKPFQNSAEFYELIYQNKDYKKETDYIYSLLNSLKINVQGELLDIGCGTGGYLPFHLEKNVNITGLDISKEMLEIAKLKFPNIEFILGDIKKIEMSKIFNFAFMSFHVINYQNSKVEVLKTFQNISNHLKKDGILIFDFWHGLAIENDPPKKVDKIFRNKSLKLVRKTTPTVNSITQIIDVCFDFSIYKEDILTNQFQENHLMRYLYKEEIEKSLAQAGFEICLCNGWLKSEAIASHDWYGIVIARKVR